MAGHMGDERVTVKKLRVVRADSERNLLLVKGTVPGAPQRARPREEGLTMPQTTLYARTGEAIGTVELSDDALRRPGQRRGPPPGRDRAARRPPPGHARHEDPRRGPRRRQEAVPPEGDRPRPPGLAHARRTTAAAASSSGRTRARYAQRLPRKMKRLALRGALTAKLGDDAIRVLDAFGARGDPDEGARRRPGSLKATGRVLIVAAGARRAARALGAQPADAWTIILADSLNVVDLLNADTIVIEQPALARLEEVYA